MILYSLICACKCQFDCWFQSGEAYEAQKKAHHIRCPKCYSVNVKRAITVPHIQTSSEENFFSAAKKANEAKADKSLNPLHKAAFEEFNKEYSYSPEKKIALEDFEDILQKHAEYVGKKFTEEARKIHHKEKDAKKKIIIGEASDEEAKELLEEGVPLKILKIKKKLDS